MPDAPTPIQEAVAWLRQMGAAWTGSPFTLWADAIEAQAAKFQQLRSALLWIEQNDWAWAGGGSNIRVPGRCGIRARKALNLSAGDMETHQNSNPSEGQRSADRDAALAITHLPASAPPLGSPASAFDRRREYVARLICRTEMRDALSGVDLDRCVTEDWSRYLPHADAVLEMLNIGARDDALKAARDLIAKDRNEIAEVAELTEFWGGGEWRKDRDITEYDAVLAQIDGVMK